MDCAEGTMCTPAGLTNNFNVQFSNGAAGTAATSDSTPRFRVNPIYRLFFVS